MSRDNLEVLAFTLKLIGVISAISIIFFVYWIFLYEMIVWNKSITEAIKVSYLNNIYLLLSIIGVIVPIIGFKPLNSKINTLPKVRRTTKKGKSIYKRSLLKKGGILALALIIIGSIFALTYSTATFSLPSFATLSFNGLDIQVFDNTKTHEVTDIDWGTFEMLNNDIYSKWKKLDIWFYFTSISQSILMDWVADNPDFIETLILYERGTKMWINWNPSSPKLVSTDWLHLSIKLRVYLDPNVYNSTNRPTSFNFYYTFTRLA